MGQVGPTVSERPVFPKTPILASPQKLVDECKRDLSSTTVQVRQLVGFVEGCRVPEGLLSALAIPWDCASGTACAFGGEYGNTISSGENFNAGELE